MPALLQEAFRTQEVGLRAFLLAALLTTTVSAAAFADASVAGDWTADAGGAVVINMNIKPDGGWSSETRQKSKVVRQMQGTYKQTQASDGSGTLVFTPTKSAVKSGGKAQVETDKYELASDGKQLKLTADGDTMVFEKH